MLKRIESEKEYWEQYTIYNSRLDKLALSAPKYITKPDRFSDEFKQIVSDMEEIGLIDTQTKEEYMNDFYEKLAKPQKYQFMVEDKINQWKEKVKAKLSLSSGTSPEESVKQKLTLK